MLNRGASNRLEDPVTDSIQLKNGNSLLHNFAEQGDFGLSVTDETGRVILWNLALTQATGVTADKALGARIWDIPFSLLPADLQTIDALERIRSPFLALLSADANSTRIQTLHEEFASPDGSVFTLNGTLQSVSTARGCSLIYTYQPSGPHLHPKNYDNFQQVVQQAHDGIVVIDDQQIILEWNDGWEQLSGISRENAVGQRLTDLVPELFQAIDWKPATSGQIGSKQAQNSALLSNAPLISEGLVKRLDGGHRWVQAMTFPLRTQNGIQFATIARDMTAQKQTEDRLKRYTRQLETLRTAGLEISGELGLDSLIWMIAPRALELLNGTGMALYLHSPEKDQLDLAITVGENLPELGKKARRGESLAGLVWDRNKSIVLENFHTGRTSSLEHSYWGKVAGAPLVYGKEFLGVIFVFSDRNFFEDDARTLELFSSHVASAIRNARLHQQLSQLAITDSLTGIYNRRHFFEMAEKEFQQALRYKRPYSIIIFDLDMFKQINDTFGHACGDEVLRSVAARCAQNMREADVLGRYGGEEFSVALPETNEVDAIALAERLRKELANTPIEAEGNKVTVTASFGVATISSDTLQLAQIINRADVALYRVKENGRNQVQVWSPGFENEV